jgi:hypothetical protein
LYAVIAHHLRGQVFQFGKSIGIHAKICVTHGRFGTLEVLSKFWEQTHIKPYHMIRKNGRGRFF